LVSVLRRAAEHRGTAFIEILQNCHVFNDGAFEAITNKNTGAANQLQLEHGKPMVFGSNHEHGLSLDRATLKLRRVENVASGSATEPVLVHDESSPMIAHLLAAMEFPEFPVPLGVLHADSQPTYEDLLGQMDAQAKEKAHGGLEAILRSGQVWQVPAG
jgi:2-oxoglutarate ferredoxin oxidoreductase subunit beta